MTQAGLAASSADGPAVDQADLGQWLSLAELAARSGAHIDRIRSWYKRASRAGRIQSRRGNDDRVLVWATPEVLASLARGNGLAGPADTAADEPAGLVVSERAGPVGSAADGLAGSTATELTAELRARAERAEERAARAESEARYWRNELDRGRVEAEAAKRDLAGLVARVEVQERLIGTLEAALAEARRPWLAKVLEGLRRKGS